MKLMVRNIWRYCLMMSAILLQDWSMPAFVFTCFLNLVRTAQLHPIMASWISLGCSFFWFCSVQFSHISEVSKISATIDLNLLEPSPLLEIALMKLSFLSSDSLSNSSGSTFALVLSQGVLYFFDCVCSESINASSYMLCKEATFLLEALGVTICDFLAKKSFRPPWLRKSY